MSASTSLSDLLPPGHSQDVNLISTTRTMDNRKLASTPETQIDQLQTPPNSASNDSKAQPVLDYIIQLSEGHYDSTWKTFALPPEAYDRLLDRVRLDPKLESCLDSLHFYYNAARSLIEFQMPNRKHEFSMTIVNREITSALNSIGSCDPRLSQYTRSIITGGADVKLNLMNHGAQPRKQQKDDNRSKYVPDVGFFHVEYAKPSFVVEVAHSQDGKDLNSKAQDYILGSDGVVRTVLCVDVEYRGTHRVTMTVWKVSTENNVVKPERVMNAEEFMDANGTPVPDKALQFELRDFFPIELHEELGAEGALPVIIKSTMLDQLKVIAEPKESAGYSRLPKRPRSATPPSDEPSEPTEEEEEDDDEEDDEYTAGGALPEIPDVPRRSSRLQN